MSFNCISLYINIPFCVSKCSYCDFFSIPSGSKTSAISSEYISSLCNEILFRFKNFPDYKLKTVYIGGGTPSLLTKEQLKTITKTINKIGLTQDYEFTFEVNPDDVSCELLHSLEECGINRISCGIQSFCDNVLKNVHRRADEKTVLDALALLKNNWHEKLSVDIICGLPGETEQSMLKGLELLVQNDIKHISFYSLCVEEETPLGKAITNGSQEYDYDFSDNLWLKGRDFLLSNGYVQYEVSNFCKPGFECSHNMTYWTHKDYLGCGAGATGTVYNIPLFGNLIDYKGEGIRYTNNKNIDEYIKFWNQVGAKVVQNASIIPQSVEKIIHKTSEFEYFMMGLRTNNGISLSEYELLFGESVSKQIKEKLELHCSQSDEDRYYMNAEQILFLNKFLEEIINMELLQ